MLNVYSNHRGASCVGENFTYYSGSKTSEEIYPYFSLKYGKFFKNSSFSHPQGAFINHVGTAGGGGFSKCPYYQIHKPYYIKLSTKGGGGKNVQKSIHIHAIHAIPKNDVSNIILVFQKFMFNLSCITVLKLFFKVLMSNKIFWEYFDVNFLRHKMFFL